MMEKKFGDCLSRLLLIREWTAARVAREINVDASYVRKWIRGERVPSLQSDYIHALANCLSSGLDHPKHMHLNTLFVKELKAMGFDAAEELSVRESIEKLLTEAQLYSLKQNKEDRKTEKDIYSEKRILRLLENLQLFANPTLNTSSEEPDEYHLFDVPPVIHGKENILKAAVALLKESIESPEEEILLTFQSEKDIFKGTSLLHANFEHLIVQALQRGCNIFHIYSLNKNIDRSFMIIKNMLKWLGYNGKYQPLYLKKYDTVQPPMEVVVVKNVGALICIGTENQEDIDTAFFYSDLDAIESLYKYYIQICMNAESLLKVLSTEEFFNLTALKDKKSGSHYACSQDLSFLTHTLLFWEKCLSKTIPDLEEREKHFSRISSCIECFHLDVAKYPIYHICRSNAIEHLVKTGSYYIPSSYIQSPSPEDIALNLENVIYLLKTYDNFHIALVDDDYMKITHSEQWDVKGGHTVTMKLYPRDIKTEPNLFLSITEGTIANAFQEYFLSIWDKISPQYRDKAYVISWFEDQLDSFKKSFL